MGSVEKIETLGLLDGPGIRVVVFLSGCKLRCKYCHNPEMWNMKKNNYTAQALADKILKYKPYFGSDGGVTFSGGEPLLQSDFLIEVSKILKENNVHIALDTAGVGYNIEEALKYVDLVLLDIKHVNQEGYKNMTGLDIDDSLKFIDILNKSNKPVWIRQVIVPGIMDNDEYLKGLNDILQKINNIEKIDFLPFHKLGENKYDELGIENPLKDTDSMDKIECDKLYTKFINDYYKNKS